MRTELERSVKRLRAWVRSAPGWDTDVAQDVKQLLAVVGRLEGLIDRHTTTTGEHPVSVAELRFLLTPELETWDSGDLPWRAGTCTTGCTPEDFS